MLERSKTIGKRNKSSPWERKM